MLSGDLRCESGYAAMTNLHLGDEITFRGRVYRLHSISPMSVGDCRVVLEDSETKDLVEIAVDEMQGVHRGDAAVDDTALKG